MREIRLNGKQYKISGEIVQRALNPWKAKVVSRGLEYSDFSQAELEEYHDFRSGIGRKRGLGSEARLDFSEGIDFATEGQAVLGPLVTTVSTINALSAPTVDNLDFETDVSPNDGFAWTMGQGTWTRDVSSKRTGTYGWGNGAITVGDNLYQDMTGYIAGATYEFKVYVNADQTNDTMKVGIDDGVSVTHGDPSSTNSWEEITVTKTLSSGASQMRLIIECDAAGSGAGVDVDDASLTVTAIGTFTPTNFIDFQNKTYCYGDLGVLQFQIGDSTWNIVALFTDPIDALVIKDSTDEYLVVSADLSAIYSIDGAAWLVLKTWFSPTSTDDFGNWSNEANAIDGDESTYATFGAATEYLELLLTDSITTDQIRIYASDGAAGDLNINCDFYYEGEWHDVYDGEVNGAEWVTLTCPAGIKEIEKARVESSDGGSCRLWEFDFEAHSHGYMASYANRLYSIHSDGSHMMYSAVNDIDTREGGFELTGNFGTVYSLFEGKLLSDGSPSLYFSGTQGLYSVDVTNELAYKQEVEYPPLTYAGKKGMYWNANLWVTTGYGILKISPSLATLIGPDQDDGLPSGYQGYIYDMVAVNNWLVFCVNGGSSNKSSILKRNSSLGGNIQVYTTASVNKAIVGLYHSPSSLYDNGRLWFAEKTDMKYMMFLDTTSNVKQVSDYEYVDDSGFGTFPIFRKLAAIGKVALGVALITKSCDDTDYIEVYYGLNGAPATTLHGSYKTSPRPTIVEFNSGLGTEFYTIQFAIKLYRS